MNLNTRIKEMARARYSGLVVQSAEDLRIEQIIASAAKGLGYDFRRWTTTMGWQDKTGGDPDTANESAFGGALTEIASMPNRTLLVMHVFNEAFRDPVARQALREAVSRTKTESKVIVLVGIFEVPADLEKHLVVIPFDLPNREELAAVARALCEGSDVKPNGELPKTVDAALGLTAVEAEDAFALSLVRSGRLDPDVVLSAKKESVRKNGVLEVVDVSTRIEDVGGLEELKAWLKLREKATSPQAREFGLEPLRGVMICGIPGCLRGDTPVHDPVDDSTLTVKERYERGVGFHVWSMTPDGPVTTIAAPPLRYDVAPMVEVRLTNEQSITVTPGHRFMTANGWMTAAEVSARLQGGERVLLATTSEHDLSVPLASALRWKSTPEGSQDDCRASLRSDDGPLLLVGVDDPTLIPPRVDARERNRANSHQDERAYGSERIRSYPPCDHPSMRGSVHLLFAPLRSDRQNETVRQLSAMPRIPSIASFQAVAQLGSASSPNDTTEPLLGSAPESIVASWDTVRYTEVESVQERTDEHYYDFHVPMFENYWACGMWHHNTGKSLIAKAIASAWRQPLIRLDMGRVMGSLVGQSEQQMRSALKTAEAIAPAVLWIDEFEKATAGMGGGGGDGGTTQRVMGTLLTWMQERTAPVTIVATANNVLALPPEMLRKGRWDEIFFVDLPDERERSEILRVHLTKRKRADFYKNEKLMSDIVQRTNLFTGSEIEEVVKIGLWKAFGAGRDLNEGDLIEACEETMPLSKTMKENIDRLRELAKGRFRTASRRYESNDVGTRRRVITSD